MKTHWKKTFNKDYLGSHDLDEGKDLVAVVDHVEVREVKDSSGKAGKCNVAIFQGQTKPMILNVTNCKIMKAFAGSNYLEDWSNIPVQIYIKEVSAFGDTVEALRIRTNQPRIDKPKLTPDHQAWTRAVEFLQGDGTIDRILATYDMTEKNKELLLNSAL